MIGVVALLVLAAGAAGHWWWRRSSRRASSGSEDRLLRICHGDAAQADRLIQGETSRSPGISRAEAASRAVQSWLRDNR